MRGQRPLRGLARAPDGKAQLDKAIQHRIADRAADLLREDDRTPRPADGIPEGREFYPGRGRRHMHRADTVDFDQQPSMSTSTAAKAKSFPARIGVTERTVIETGAVVPIASGPLPSIRTA